MILVGDSLGMVMHGLETTVPVTLDMMILQGHAVMRGSQRALVVVDMPFGSYEALEGAGLHVGGAGAEGNRLRRHQARRRRAAWPRPSRFLVERGVPVMAHVGLTPQAINTHRLVPRAGPRRGRLGADRGRRPRGRRRRRVLGGARGDRRAARRAASPSQVAIPTIGIGASAACDGQILVLEDMLGLSPRVPKFVKRYGELGPSIEAAVEGYADEVRARAFPGPEHVYPMKARKPVRHILALTR